MVLNRELFERRLRLYAPHPELILHRLRYWVWSRMHPNEPWLTPGAVAYLRSHLTNGMVGLEWGSGRSTAWYAHRIKRLTSVEHHSGWYHDVKSKLAAARVSNVDYRLVPLEHPENEPTVPEYDPVPRYVAVVHEVGAEPLDFVVVDGHYRQACVRAVTPKIRPGGLLLVDDSSRLSDLAQWGVPRDWAVTHQSSNGLKTTTVWQKPLERERP